MPNYSKESLAAVILAIGLLLVAGCLLFQAADILRAAGLP